MNSVETKISAALRDFNITFDGAVLVGFSGGADSSALLHYLYENTGVKIYAAHVNHQIRGDEADRDENFCKDVCQKLGIEFFSSKIDVPAIAEQYGQSLEEAARDVRYRFFSEIMNAHPDIKFLATAHNADDNFETVIFNMIRGTSIRGMTGIPPIRNNYIVRPLIYCSKAEIIDWCESKNIDYVTDSTNSDTDYTRNYIRHEIIPRLLKINPESYDAVTRMCSLLRSDSDFLDRCADDFISKNVNGATCSRGSLCQIINDEAVLSRVLIKMYENGTSKFKNPLSYEHVKSIIELLRQGETNSRLSLPEKITFRLTHFSAEFLNENEYNKLISPEFHYEYMLNYGLNAFPQFGFVIVIARDENDDAFVKAKNIYKLFIHKTLKFDKINGSIFVRNRKNGDSYTVRKMTRRLKRVFSDAHMTPEKRAVYPVICDNDGIVWVPLCGVADRVYSNSPLEESVIHLLYAEI